MADMIFENPWLADRWAENERLDDDMSEGEVVGLCRSGPELLSFNVC